VDIKSILIFCLPGIGDSLLATPAWRALKAAYPQAHVTAITMFPSAAAILRRCPFIDEVENYDFMNTKVVPALQYIWKLRRRRFDVTILTYPANRLEYNIVARLIGSPIRIGHRYNHVDFVCGNWLNTHTIREDDGLTNIEENLRLIELLTHRRCDDHRLAFHLDPEHTAYAEQWLTERNLNDRLLIGMHAGGSTAKNHINKRYRPESFAEVGRLLTQQSDATILLFGGSEEDALKTQIVEAIGPRAISVQTPNMLTTCAVMARCRHFISNDSALLHIAGALDIPTTAVFGPTNPTWVRIPTAQRTEVTLGLPCQPCFYYSPRHLACRTYGDFRCLRDLPPQKVAQTVMQQLAPK